MNGLIPGEEEGPGLDVRLFPSSLVLVAVLALLGIVAAILGSR